MLLLMAKYFILDRPSRKPPLLCVSQCLLKSHLFKVCLFVCQVTFILYSTLQRLKKIGNVTVKNYLSESLLSLLCFIMYGQGSFEKGLM